MSAAILGIALVALGVAAAWSRALLRSPSSVHALTLAGKDLVLTLASGESYAAEASGRRFVSRLMVTLPVRRPVRRTILVTAGMLEAPAYRQLRIWALWGRLPAVAPVRPAV